MDSGTSKAKAVFLFTTFPVLSETFLQREVRALRKTGLSFQAESLWGGDSEWEGMPVGRFGFPGVLMGILCLVVWLFKQPSTVFHLLGLLWRPRRSGWLNWGENLLGACHGLRHAAGYANNGIAHCHAVWSSAPAMSAYTVCKLNGIPFSIAGHAYDLFEKGGDGWIREKLAAAKWARSSTQAGVDRLLEFGADSQRVILARRGLVEVPAFQKRSPFSTPLRILSVGRMVEKMGYERQIPLLAELKKSGIPFKAIWIGDGPERSNLEQQVKQADLEDLLEFRGRRPYAEVEQAYQESDILLFTGKVDNRGDRAGLPNAVAEAMAWGTIVFATDVGAVREAVTNGHNGIVWDNEPSLKEIMEIVNNQELQSLYRLNGWKWIHDNYDINKNLDPMVRLLMA
jgi:glycosyltransferase involved in cell wall biosynthesis